MEKEPNILEDILELLQARVGNKIKANNAYKTSVAEVLTVEKQYNALNLTEHQRKVIDTYIDCINDNGAIYGECAYKIGFRYCILLLKQLEVLN